MCICDYVFLVKTCYYDIINIIALADKPTNKESESESVTSVLMNQLSSSKGTCLLQL